MPNPYAKRNMKLKEQSLLHMLAALVLIVGMLGCGEPRSSYEVTVGMTTEQAEDLLGKPGKVIGRCPDGGTEKWYKHGKNSWIIVAYDDKNKVTQITNFESRVSPW